MKKIFSAIGTFFTSVFALVLFQIGICIIGLVVFGVLQGSSNLDKYYFIPYLLILLITSIYYLICRKKHNNYYDTLDYYERYQGLFLPDEKDKIFKKLSKEPNPIKETFFNCYLTCYILLIVYFFFSISNKKVYESIFIMETVRNEVALFTFIIVIMSIYFIVKTKSYNKAFQDGEMSGYQDGYKKGFSDAKKNEE